MSSPPASVLRPGVYAPVLTPFKAGTEEIDLAAFRTNVSRLASAGVGLVLSGTLGEASLMSQEERQLLVQTAREVLDGLKGEKVPIIAGCGGGSVRESIALAKDAGAAGADAVILVAPAYYAFVYGKNRDALKDFYSSVADASPVPVMLYNIPFAAGGIDLDADFLTRREHQNICGVKLTCYNISKGHRVALHVNSAEYKARHPVPFLVLPGATDYLLPGLVARQHGCIGGPANLYPKTIVKLFKTGTKALETGDSKVFAEAQQLQDLVTTADSVINRVGFLGIKTAINIHIKPEGNADYQDLGGSFRKPLPAPSQGLIKDVTEGLKEIYKVENSL